MSKANKREIEERLPPVESPLPGRGPTGTGDRDLSGNVPWGPAAEAGAAPGLSAATPTPAVLPAHIEDADDPDERAPTMRGDSTSPTGPMLPQEEDA